VELTNENKNLTPKQNKMKTLISLFKGKNENAVIDGFENYALSINAMNNVRGGDAGDPPGDAGDIWLPDDDDQN